jgi:hypothetical protein
MAEPYQLLQASNRPHPAKDQYLGFASLPVLNMILSMKTKSFLRLLAVSATIPFSTSAGTIELTFAPVEDFRDFSISGLSEESTLPLFEAELSEELESVATKYLAQGEKLVIYFTNIDMAGDIQPWRNRHNADIRYVENIYPPRLSFTYQLLDAEGKILSSGEETISDLSFMMNVLAPIRSGHQNFFYESTLLRDWIRKTYRDRTELATK